MEQVQVEAIRALTKEIPLNDFGLPTGVYRTDLLPYHDYLPPNTTNGNINGHIGESTELGAAPILLPDNSDSTDGEEAGTEIAQIEVYRVAGFPAQSLQGAFVPLQFDEGFPAFVNGSPFWARLDFEPSDAFEAFQRYLQMNLGHIAHEDAEDYDGKAAGDTRSVNTLAANLHPDSRVLDIAALYHRYYHLYYWGMRAHAYDLYRVAQFRVSQELRAVETQDEHYVQARRLRHKLTQHMESDVDFWDLMTPSVAVKLFTAITQLERISAGIPAAGPITEEMMQRAGTSFSVTMKTIAQTSRKDGGITVDEEGEILDAALESPEATEVLQSLIIKTGGG